MQHEPYIQPRVGRLPTDRPIMKLSVGLIETYKQINQVRFRETEIGWTGVRFVLLFSFGLVWSTPRMRYFSLRVPSSDFLIP